MSTIRTIDSQSPLLARSVSTSARLLSLLVKVLVRFEATVEKSRSRRALSALSDEQLKDIGLSRSDAFREASRPFWS